VTPSRSFWPAALSIGYVGIAAAELGRRSLPWMVALAMIAILFVVYRRTERGISSERKLAGKVVRAVVWALALWLTARVGPSGSAALDAAANAGVGTAAVTSLFSRASKVLRGCCARPARPNPSTPPCSRAFFGRSRPRCR
jgi:hypothetical protein